MPAKSKAQQRLMALALHNPSKVKKENKGVLKMGKKSLEDFAKTKRTGLPSKVKSGDSNYLLKYNLLPMEEVKKSKKKKSEYNIKVVNL